MYQAGDPKLFGVVIMTENRLGADRRMTNTGTTRPTTPKEGGQRPGEVWGAESAADALIVVRFG